jgi:PIN domain nuclease of toxin-antitoxin system
MNYLLDTHTFIWAILDPGKLPGKVISIIKDNSNRVYVSAVTFWEISLKFSLKKMDLKGVAPQMFPALSLQTGFTNMPLLADECAEYHLLKITDHKDPFDRILIWQAIKQRLIFISKDKNSSLYLAEGLQTLW